MHPSSHDQQGRKHRRRFRARTGVDGRGRRDRQRGLSVGAEELSAMGDRTLITTGIVGALVAAVCCATPLLAVVFGAVGLTAWLANADYVVIPALILSLGLIAVGLYRRRARPK